MVNHDRLFKQLISTFFFDFIELFAPDLANYADRASLVAMDKEVFTDLSLGDSHEADLVMQLQVRGEESFFLVHIETQAHAQSEFPLRLFRYFARLHEKYGMPVYPMVLFSFDKPRKQQASSYEVKFPSMQVLKFQYQVIQLNRLNWREYLKKENKAAAALMAKMRFAESERVRVKLECLRAILRLQTNPAEASLISKFVDTYIPLNSEEKGKFKQELSQLSKKEQEGVMEFETSWQKEGYELGLKQGVQQGLEQGIQQGVQQGLERGRVELILCLLSHRLGELDKDSVERVGRLSAPELDALGKALLDISEIADLRAWLKSRE